MSQVEPKPADPYADLKRQQEEMLKQQIEVQVASIKHQARVNTTEALLGDLRKSANVAPR